MPQLELGLNVTLPLNISLDLGLEMAHDYDLAMTSIHGLPIVT